MVITTAFVSMPSFIMGSFLLIVFSVKLGWVPANGATAEGLILPIITLALYPMSYITRLTRSSMLDVLGQDYIRTARAKGVSGKKIIFGHALKNSLIPVITYFGPMLAFIVTGSMVVEHFRRAGYRPPVRIQHHQPRLHHDYGDDHFPRLFNRDYESDQRPALQGG